MPQIYKLCVLWWETKDMLLSYTRDILTEYPYEPHKALTIDMTFPCCHVGPTLSSNHPPAPNPALLSRCACLYLVVSINPETFSPFSFLRRLREKLSFVKFYPFLDISSSESDFMASEKGGPVTSGSWIRRPENSNMVVLGRSAHGDSTTTRSVIQFFSFDPITTSLSSSPLVCSLSLSLCLSFLSCFLFLSFWKVKFLETANYHYCFLKYCGNFGW